jgi:hypothetical protein
MTLRTTHVLLIGVLLVASGVAHGWWTSRWSATAPEAAGLELLQIDDVVGDWKPGPFFQINPADMPERSQTASRRFESTRLGKSVVVSVTSGLPGVVAVHTPDICYLGTGYKLRSAVRRDTIPIAGGEAHFYSADFEKPGALGVEAIRVRWSWTADGHWQAPDYPRWFFARSPILYKLYIVQPLSDDEDLIRDDPYRKFVADLVPVLNRHFAR